VTVRYFQDPSNPNVYVQQTVATGFANGAGYVGTAAAWKVQIVDSFPSHPDSKSDTITLDWGYSWIGP